MKVNQNKSNLEIAHCLILLNVVSTLKLIKAKSSKKYTFHNKHEILISEA